MGMTITAYAKHRGCSRPTIYAAIRAGHIVRLKDGTIDHAAADLRWDPRHKIEGEPERTPDYLKSRARKEAALAESAELRNAELKGRLVDVDEMERVWFNVLRTLRDRLLGVPDRVGASHEMRQKIDAEIREALTAAPDRAPQVES